MPGKGFYIRTITYPTMSTAGIELTNSGVRLKGHWDQVCDFAKGFENVIKKTDMGEQTLSQFQHWRPRKNDSEEDIKLKTVNEAKVDMDHVKNSKLVKKVDRMSCSKEDVMKKTTSRAIKTIYYHSAKCFIKMEEIVYGKLMLNFNPYFFDREEFSANLRVKDKNRCELNINFNDDDLRNEIKALVKG